VAVQLAGELGAEVVVLAGPGAGLVARILADPPVLAHPLPHAGRALRHQFGRRLRTRSRRIVVDRLAEQAPLAHRDGNRVRARERRVGLARERWYVLVRRGHGRATDDRAARLGDASGKSKHQDRRGGTDEPGGHHPGVISGNSESNPSVLAAHRPRSVIKPLTRRAGVTSNAGLAAGLSIGTTRTLVTEPSSVQPAIVVTSA